MVKILRTYPHMKILVMQHIFFEKAILNLSHWSTVSTNFTSDLTDFSLTPADLENLQWAAIALSDERFGMIACFLH